MKKHIGTRFNTIASAIVVLAILCGCTTIVPDNIVDEYPSYDEGVLNSGFIGFTNHFHNNTALRVGIITPTARAKYNMLIDKYGLDFIPAMTNDVGVINVAWTIKPYDQVYLIDKGCLRRFITMNRWNKEGRQPKRVGWFSELLSTPKQNE